MKRLSTLTRVGISFMVAGLFIYGVWVLWLFASNDHPIFMPVSLAVGEVRTPEFKVHMNKPYIISVQVEDNFPPDVQSCMTGMPPYGPRPNCDNKQHLLKANWRLWSDGYIVAQGSSGMIDKGDSMPGHWSECYGAHKNLALERDIGSFKGKLWRKYLLDVVFTRDETALAIAYPHLSVEVISDIETTMAENLFYSALCILIVFVGMIVLVFSGVRRWRNRSGERAL